jgi:hypothetical protein
VRHDRPAGRIPNHGGTVHRSLKFLRCGTTGQPAAFQTMAVRGHFKRRF